MLRAVDDPVVGNPLGAAASWVWQAGWQPWLRRVLGVRNLMTPEVPMTTTDNPRCSLDTRQGLLGELAAIDVHGWDGPAGRRLLAYVRSHIVRPQVVAAGLRGRAAEQAEATGWAAAWEVLSRPGIRTATSPWGLLWVAVRRAVLGELVAGAHLAGARNAWRAESARHAQGAAAGARGPADSAVSLDVLVARGWQPVAEPALSGVELGPRLEAIVTALVEAGWAQPAARGVVEAVAVTAVRDGKASAEALGWRPLAARLGLPPWQVRRVSVLLLGAPGWPGVVERMATQGRGVLEEPAMGAAVRSTVLGWWPPPPVAARRRGHPRPSPARVLLAS